MTESTSLPVVGRNTQSSCGGHSSREEPGTKSTCSGGCSSCTRAGASRSEQADSGPLLAAPKQVLSTLDQDGSRRWIQPRIVRGRWWKLRRPLAVILMFVFIAVPHVRIQGAPLIRLDIIAREFTLGGHKFLPTDTLLLALMLLSSFVGIVFLTTVMGRVWCGWACPQTVYMEFLFRPIDRLFFGTNKNGGTPKRELGLGLQSLRLVIYVAATGVLAHTFLAYFVGTEKLAAWLLGSPTDHPIAFAVMVVTTGLLTYDFYYFREQTCMIACPYGRFQSVMLDQHSLLVAYDQGRGEPRRKGKRVGLGDSSGDCLDCNQCVVVCPTGIDIRNGLQMECISCTQCIDACDRVMQKAGMQTGLIRYTSQDALAGKPWRLLRARTLIYPMLMICLLGGLIWAASGKFSFDVRVIRGKGAPFSMQTAGWVTNTFSIRLVNRSGSQQTYAFDLLEPSEAQLEVIEPSMLEMEPGDSILVPVQIHFPQHLSQNAGRVPIRIAVRDSGMQRRVTDFFLLGPR